MLGDITRSRRSSSVAYGHVGLADGLRKAAVAAFLVMMTVVCLTRADAQTRPLRVVALGDSLSAGYNLPEAAAFPMQLQRALLAKGRQIVIDNAGVSGDTSQGGLDRLDWSVPDGVDGVILELGANDALRGLNPEDTRRNLDEIVLRLKRRGIGVLMAGMRAPPNMGRDYATAFDALFGELAQKHGLVLYPFFLDGVAGRPELNQRDGIHPTAEGVRVIVERMLPTVETFLDRLPARR